MFFLLPNGFVRHLVLALRDLPVILLYHVGVTNMESLLKKAKDNMIRIHYKDHHPDFTTRWHFTSDRISSHPGTVDVTKTLLPIENLKTATVTLNQKENGEELLDLNWNREIEVYYIPNERLTQKLLKKLPKKFFQQ